MKWPVVVAFVVAVLLLAYLILALLIPEDLS